MVTGSSERGRVVVAVAAMLAMAAVAWPVARIDWGHGACVQSGAVGRADSQWRACLREQPLDAGVFMALGDGAAAQGNQDAASAFRAVALRRNPRDPGVRIAWLELYLSKGDARAAMHQLDALLRIAPASGEPWLRRTLQAIGADPALGRALADTLATDPPWRGMLPAAAGHAPEAAVAAMMARLAARTPLLATEVALRVAVLEREGRALEARRVWAAALPPRLAALDGVVFDGGFEAGEGPPPYGWRLHSPAGASIGLDPSHRVEGRSSLGMEFDGGIVDTLDVAQDLVVPPGVYRLELQADIDLEAAPRGFAWVLACRGDGYQTARVELPARTQGWRRFAVAFAVTPSCPLQRLSLVHEGRNPGERRPVGTLFFDQIRLIAVDQ